MVLAAEPQLRASTSDVYYREHVLELLNALGLAKAELKPPHFTIPSCPVDERNTERGASLCLGDDRSMQAMAFTA